MRAAYTPGMFSELDFVAEVLSSLPADRRLEVPPGDDAAVLRPPAQRRTVVTVDMLMEGTDFVLGPDCPPEAVGHKALAVSLSDLAAMGSRPEAAVVAVALPRQGGAALGAAIQAGIAAIAAEHGVALAGGDTRILEIAVIADSPEPVPCCGGCRQKIAEFAAPDVRVTLATTDGKTKVMTVADLLPGVFTAAHMDKGIGDRT